MDLFFGFRLLGFRIQGTRFEIYKFGGGDLGEVQGSVFRVSSLEFRV